jgi:ariadne-1
MDSDEDIMYDDDYDDSGNESSGDDDVEFAMVEEPNNPKERQELDEYPYEVLTTEQILQHMNECMKEVNIVVEVYIFISL